MKRGRLDARWWAVGGFGDARAASFKGLHRRLLVVVVGTRAFSAGGDEGLHDGALRGALGDARRGAPRRGDARFERRAELPGPRGAFRRAFAEPSAAFPRRAASSAMNASTSAVSFSAGVFPTLLISSPVAVASVAAPTFSSGCSLIPLSMISARCFSAGPNCLVR